MQFPYKRSQDNISYSTLMNFKKCGHFYKLTVIDNLGKFESTLDTILGTLLHKYVGLVVSNQLSSEVASATFTRTWLKLGGIYDKHINHERYDIQKLNLAGVNILKTVKASFEKNVPGYALISLEESIEKRLRVKINDKHRQFFKGFIDFIIRVGDKIVIVDFKTCGSLYYFKKKIDKYKEMQLVLYKHFYAKLMGIEEKDVETYFVTLEKNYKVKEPVQFISVTAGNVKINNHLKILDNALGAINRQDFIKNRANCIDDFGTCVFYDTLHCTR